MQTTLFTHALPPGTDVGCRYRWPYDSAHPDCWQPPHRGTVLAINDPRAWTGTLAFPLCSHPDGPPQERLDAHVARCLDQGLLTDSVPVLWTWGDGQQCVQWDTQLSPYADELAAWAAARYAQRDVVRRIA